jgi:hypothetical protein
LDISNVIKVFKAIINEISEMTRYLFP